MSNRFLIFDSTIQESVWEINPLPDGHIKKIIEYGRKAKIDYISIGYLSNYEKETSPAAIKNCEELKRRIGVAGQTGLVALADLALRPQPVQHYSKAVKNRNDFLVCVRFTKRNIKRALQYCADLKNAGIQMMIDPLFCDDYSVEEFNALVKTFLKYAPSVFFVDDSRGALGLNELAPFFSVVNSLAQTAVVGFRSNINAENMVKKLLSSTGDTQYLIASSICGIGKYMNMCRTEKLVCLLQNQDAFRYDFMMVAMLYDFYLKHYVKGTGIYSVVSVLKQSSREAKYMEYYCSQGLQNWEIYLCYKEIGVKNYSIQYAESVLKSVRREYWQKKMCIIVPTCNRPETIEYWLEHSGKRLYHYGITLVIYDSSSDDKTRWIAKQYIKQGYRNIRYVRYDGYYDGRSLDHKLIEAYKEFADQYEYIWICRDGIVIEWDYIHGKLKQLIDEDNELIVVDSDWRDIWGTGKREYHNAGKLFADQCIRMVTLGTMIVRNDFIMQVINDIEIDDSNYSLWQVIAVFQYYENHPVHAACYTGNVFAYNPCGTISSFWNSNGKALWQWAERWYTVIESLPAMYDKYKADVYHIDMVDFHPFSLHTLMLIKSNNGLRIRDVNHYKKYFKYVHDRPIWQYYAIAMLPIPHKALKRAIMQKKGILYRVMKGVSSTLKKLKNILKENGDDQSK